MAVATTAKMSCERCGQQVIAADGLCEACVEWSRGAGGLSEKDVVEAVQFSGSPVASSDRVVAAIGISAGAAALSLFIVVYPLLDTYALVSSGGRLVESHRPQLLALLVTFLAALLSGVSSVGCALVGRRRPLTAAIIAAVVVAVLTIPVIVVTANNEEFMFRYLDAHTFSGRMAALGAIQYVLILQGVSVLILLVAALLAGLRRRQLGRARRRLVALGPATDVEPPADGEAVVLDTGSRCL